MAGSRVVEYFIRAKDETAKAVQEAVVRVRSLYDGAKDAIRIKAKDETKAATDSAKKKLGEVADKAREAGKAVGDGVGHGGAEGFAKLEQSAGRAATNIITQMAGIPGPIGGILGQIGQMASVSFGGIASAVTAVVAIANKVADAVAAKWRLTAQTVADNWRNMATRMGEATARLGKDLDRQNAALRRGQEARRAMGAVEDSGEAASRSLEREREMQRLMAGGGTTEQAAALQKRWAEEDKYLALLAQELDLDRQMADEDERIMQRARDKAALEERAADAWNAIAKNNAEIARVVERSREAANTPWAARRARITEEVQAKSAALDAKGKADLQAYLDAQDKLVALGASEEEGRALADRIVRQKEILATQRESLKVSLENADALEAASKAEEEARKAAEAASREAERAAQEELRRQEQIARERERIERELAAERERLAEQAYRREVKLAQEAAAESSRAQSAAQSRLSAANSRLAEAWTWYRDPTRMQTRIDDYRQQQQAEKQFEKDFARLRAKASGRFDWRTVEMGKLSAEEEATRQVALAKEEQQAAQQALNAIEANTRDLAAKLDELLSMKEA